MPEVEHRIWLHLDWMQELRTGRRVRVPYRYSTRRPKIGDVVEARAYGEGENKRVRVVVVSIEDDAAVTTTLEKAD